LDASFTDVVGNTTTAKDVYAKFIDFISFIAAKITILGAEIRKALF